MKKSKSQIVKEATIWYSQNRGLYKQLCSKVHNIIAELLDINNINIHAIFSRAKEVDSFKEKIRDVKYDDPQNQITDLAGIRVICYVESDLALISNIIEENFLIDPKNSLDKSKLLGIDKVGYKSVHYVAELKADRIQLPEYKKFNGAKFEIQIRTILQHAWAEIEHDRNYKFSGELPDDIKRRFKLIAGTLELADREFNSIASEIDKVQQEVSEATKTGKLDFEINTTTLKQFLMTRFEKLLSHGLNPVFPGQNSETDILTEIKKFGLHNLNELNDIIPSDYISTNLKLYQSMQSDTNFVGLIRLLLMCVDWKKYFENSYQKDWKGIGDPFAYKLLEHYKVPLDQLKKKYKIDA